MENGFTKAKITKAYGDIRVGDLLDTFHEVEPIIETDAPRKPAISGFVIAAHRQLTITGAMDIVFIDKGSNDSLELGDILKTTSVDKFNNSRTVGAIPDYKPEEFNSGCNRKEKRICNKNRRCGKRAE